MAAKGKETSHPMAALAARVLANNGKVTAAEAMALAGSVLSQYPSMAFEPSASGVAVKRRG